MEAFWLNILFWIWSSMGLFIIIIFISIIMVLLKLFTHGFDELKAKFKGVPICMFFEDTRYVVWKPIKPDSGIIEDKEYGSFLINEQGSYIDRDTKNIYLPFDSSFGSGANVKAFKMTDDLWKVFKDEKKLDQVRTALMSGKLEHSEIEGLRESINFSHLRSLSNTILPHTITAKVEKMLVQKMQGMRQVNVPQIILIFAGIIGAVVISAILLKMYGG